MQSAPTAPPEFQPPSRAQWQQFALNGLALAGLTSLSAGVVFFLAANWKLMNRWQRFSLFEAGFVLCAVVAWQARAGSLQRQAGLIGLTLLSGALLGLYGQTYQTGADTYELFLTWAVLALPFAYLSRHPAHWAVWALIANVGLGLYVDTSSTTRRFALIFGHNRDVGPSLWMLMAWANVAFALAMRLLPQAEWLSRMLLTVAAVIGSQAIALQMGWNGSDRVHPVNLLLYLMLGAVLVVVALRLRPKDIFPLALLGSSLIYLSVVYAVQRLQWHSESTFFLLAFWVLGSTAALVFALLRIHRRWQSPAVEENQ